jgi:hypothetical protein
MHLDLKIRELNDIEVEKIDRLVRPDKTALFEKFDTNKCAKSFGIFDGEIPIAAFAFYTLGNKTSNLAKLYILKQYRNKYSLFEISNQIFGTLKSMGYQKISFDWSYNERLGRTWVRVCRKWNPLVMRNQAILNLV